MLIKNIFSSANEGKVVERKLSYTVKYVNKGLSTFITTKIEIYKREKIGIIGK